MNKNLLSGFRRNLIVLSIILTVVFLVINVSFYLINTNYLSSKVKEENEAFSLLVTHLINENDIGVALEYMEHYTHIHEVEIRFLDSNNAVLFVSDLNAQYSKELDIETLQGDFTILIDNTGSVTVGLIERNILYLNSSLLLIYLIAFAAVHASNKTYRDRIEKDIFQILAVIDQESSSVNEYHYLEFKRISDALSLYLQNIDLLKEQKEINVKGLAHDIKTPLTIIFSYINHVQKGKPIMEQESISAFSAANTVNELLNDLLEDNYSGKFKTLTINQLLKEKVEEYKEVLKNKSIQIELSDSAQIHVVWNQRDFKRMIDNLISNAFYYSKENSMIQIKVSDTAGKCIEVSSEPIELKKIDIEGIFKKGYREKSSHIVNKNGQGLGLYMCKVLLLPIKGNISAQIRENRIYFTIRF